MAKLDPDALDEAKKHLPKAKDAAVCGAIAAYLNAAGFSDNPWRPAETLPGEGVMVDLWCESGGLSAGGARVTDCWKSSGKWWRYDEDGDDQCRSEVHGIRFWMPVPPRP